MAEPITAVDFYPWQQSLAQQWLTPSQRFAHAWLIYGLTGIGKVQFAKAGAASLLCEQPNQSLACGKCSSCQWVLAGNHPDLRHICPDSIMAAQYPERFTGGAKTPSKHIRVEQIRELSTWFNTATHRGGARVAILYPAESLNAISANALLKVLEEPSAHTVFLLVAHQYEQLLPTIISRCRRLHLPIPNADQSVEWLTGAIQKPEQWLSAAGGAPLAAYETAQTHPHPYPAWLASLCQSLAQGSNKAILQLAPELEKLPTIVWLDTLQRLYIDLELNLQQLPARYYPSLSPLFQKMSQTLTSQAVHQQWKWLVTQKRHAAHPLNAKLLVHTALERVAQTHRYSS